LFLLLISFSYEKIEYDFTFIDGVFNIENSNLAHCYKRWGRCLAVTDINIANIYGKDIQRYFDHHGIQVSGIFDLLEVHLTDKKSNSSRSTRQKLVRKRRQCLLFSPLWTL